jgi:hypothetical protein
MTTINVINSTTLDNMDACTLWLESFESQSTMKSYKIHLLMFCKHYNTDPDSLVRSKADQIMVFTHEKCVVAINGKISNAFYNYIRIRIDRIFVYQSFEFLNF